MTSFRSIIRIESEVIQNPPANGVGVLILRKGFTVPGDVAAILSDTPGSAAISLVHKGAVICPTWFLRRRMKCHVTNSSESRSEHVKGLNRTIEVLVIDSVFVVPLVQAELVSPCIQRTKCHRSRDPAGTGSPLRLSRPSHNRRLHPCGRSSG